jgi:choline dehydrogenase-like flavoprotein/glycosidase
VVTIRFTTTTYRPPHVITLRTSKEGWESRDIPGMFEGDQWRFTLTDQTRYGGTFQFKLVLDRTYWMALPDLTVDGSKQADFSIDEQNSNVGFDMRLVRRNTVVVERGWVEERLLRPTFDEARVWDVIVIGSGMGGGIVAEALADLEPGRPAHEQLNVLVLEAGSYIFPVHMANLPRQHRVGEFTKHVWHLWDELEVRDYTNADQSEYRGSLGINFGGRSIVWGGLIPRMTEWELEPWPQAIRDDLLRDPENPMNRYRQAERLMTMTPEDEGVPAPTRTEYHQRVKQHLIQALPDLSFEDAPSAVQSTTEGGSGIPAGMFSTADLLMESRLTEVENSDGAGQHLYINLHHRVVRLELGEQDGAEEARVIAHDLLNDEEKEFKARRVILAAGSIGSPVIALRSGLRNPSKLMGRGLTDHPIFYTHFAVPHSPPGGFFDASGTCKLLARHRDGKNHPYNIVIEIGADLLHGRYVDPDILAAQQAKNNKQMLCEVVFIFDAPLLERNSVSLTRSPEVHEATLRGLDPPSNSWPIIEMKRCTSADVYIPEIARIRDAIVDAIGGQALNEKQLPDMDVVVDGPGMPNTSETTSFGKLGLRRAKLGAAGHELGTLRLGDSDESVVDANLKVRGYDNLYVCDLSVFPTAPAANPSLTLAALAMRLSEHMKRELAPPLRHALVPPPEAFSRDLDWMPALVLIAKTTFVWLSQLSKEYRCDISRLDEIPDEELDRLARSGINGLWLVGVWERSPASRRIKQLCGNSDAVASAYSLFDYEIARDLGGTEAYENLKIRAWARGIRMASDMVPNHVGIDSTWITNHPDWFIALNENPYPWYSYTGPDLSNDGRVGTYIEDHYYDRTDAAVVFKRVDRVTGREQYVYHGNDGTAVPWNDTAQLNYLMPEVRKAVIETILLVAQKFPIIRFDAAMTLAKQHVQRLWFPESENGAAIATRAGRGMSWEQFNAAMPTEFWREVVDEIARKAPNTLLMAEAFWLLEGYFVRTLGMHRVYNSEFMIMLRNGDNADYRKSMKSTLEFNPEILRRYVNFMTNPDERTAVDQFGKGDKYFGVCTMMATLPGLPMFGHGQVEGLTEKYGMEFYRPLWDETPDRALIRRHEQEIFPLLLQRHLFAGVDDFLLYDFVTADGTVNDDVYAYSNWLSEKQRTLVLYHHRFADTRGCVRTSVAYGGKAGGSDTERVQMQRTLADGLGLHSADDGFVVFRDTVHNREFLRSTRQLFDVGLEIELWAYTCHVFTEIDQVADPEGLYAELAEELNGGWVPSVEEALGVPRTSPA